MHLGKYRSLQLDSNRWSLTTTCAHTSKKGLSTGAREAETFLGKFKEKKAEKEFLFSLTLEYNCCWNS